MKFWKNNTIQIFILSAIVLVLLFLIITGSRPKKNEIKDIDSALDYMIKNNKAHEIFAKGKVDWEDVLLEGEKIDWGSVFKDKKAERAIEIIQKNYTKEKIDAFIEKLQQHINTCTKDDNKTSILFFLSIIICKKIPYVNPVIFFQAQQKIPPVISSKGEKYYDLFIQVINKFDEYNEYEKFIINGIIIHMKMLKSKDLELIKQKIKDKDFQKRLQKSIDKNMIIIM